MSTASAQCQWRQRACLNRLPVSIVSLCRVCDHDAGAVPDDIKALLATEPYVAKKKAAAAKE